MRHTSILLTFACLLTSCSSSDVSIKPSGLGSSSSMQELVSLINEPGPIEFVKHTAANWEVPLSGLLNLEHAKTIAAGIEDRSEPIQIFVYSLKHPSMGTYIVDSGVASQFGDPEVDNGVSWLVAKAMNINAMEVLLSTKALLSKIGNIDGVLLTHIHLDHIMGLPDIASDTAVYIGPGDTGFNTVTHVVTRGTTNRMLQNIESLREWQFAQNGVIDVFGDGSLWALHTPGHTPGATAYLARTPQGPQLMIGDATHTRWGWDNGVEAGSYSEDGPQSAISLLKLRQLVERFPSIEVHPGHQQ